MLKHIFAIACVICIPFSVARADQPAAGSPSNSGTATLPPSAFATPPEDGTPWYKMPDLIDFAVGGTDFDRVRDANNSADMRVEYRSGLSLLPKIASVFKNWDPYFQMRPMAGVEGTSKGALYGFGGFMFDVPIGRNFYVSENEAVGAYYRGNGKILGSVIEFRSGLEGGYRFDNNMRFGLSISHISNAKITRVNPGTEIASANVYIPVNWIFGE